MKKQIIAKEQEYSVTVFEHTIEKVTDIFEITAPSIDVVKERIAEKITSGFRKEMKFEQVFFQRKKGVYLLVVDEVFPLNPTYHPRSWQGRFLVIIHEK